MREIEVTIQNNDGVRGVDLVLAAATSAGLCISFDDDLWSPEHRPGAHEALDALDARFGATRTPGRGGASSTRIWLEAGQARCVSVRIASTRGHSGDQQATLTLLFARAPTPQPFDVAPPPEVAQDLHVRVVFPGRVLALSALTGVLLGGVGGALFRLIRGAIVPGAPFDVLASASGALPGDLASRGAVLVVSLVLLLMLVLRIWVGTRDASKSIDAGAARLAWNVGAVAAMSFGSINGCRGCVGDGHLGSDGAVGGCALGFCQGAGLGAALFLLMLFRPGVVERDRGRAIACDILFGLGAVSLLAASDLGDLLMRSLFYLDVGAMSVVVALGSSGPLSETRVVGAYLFAGALVGLLLGLRRTLVSIGRPRLAYAQLTGGLALLLVLVLVRGTAAAIQGGDSPFAPSGATCAAAVDHAARVSYAEAPVGTAPTFDAFRTSAEYGTEAENALRRCRRARREDVECVAAATSRAGIAACGPFWMGD
jgi:hypothetical protein